MNNNKRRRRRDSSSDNDAATRSASRPDPDPVPRGTARTARRSRTRGAGRGQATRGREKAAAPTVETRQRERGNGPTPSSPRATAASRGRARGRPYFTFGATAWAAQAALATLPAPAADAPPRRGSRNRQRAGARGRGPARPSPPAPTPQLNIRGLAGPQRTIRRTEAAPPFPPGPVRFAGADPNILRAWKPGQDPIYGDHPDAYVGIQRRQASDKALPFWFRHGKLQDSNLSVKQQTTDVDRRAWLSSMPLWKNKLGDGWVGKKVLGMGTFGIAGLWEREDDLHVNGDAITKVVVKQSGGSSGVLKQLATEGLWLKRFRQTGTEHVVKLYADVHFERGQGTISRIESEGKIAIDSTTTDIGRLYLEFCEGGDFKVYLKEMYRNYTAENPMPEELIWHVFKCFALGLMVMENGQESISGGSWAYEVVHFDLKPENLLVGNFNTTHTKTPPIKLADFGATASVDDDQSELDAHRRGTPLYRGPEQDDPNYPESIRRAGTPLNTWAFAKTLYLLITRGRQFNMMVAPDPTFRAEVGAGDEVIETMGVGLLTAPYSVLLRKTVLRCLAYDLRKRPTPRELLGIVDGVIGDLENLEGGGDSDGAGCWGGSSGKPQPDDGADLPDYIDSDGPTVAPPRAILFFPQAGDVATAGPVGARDDPMQGVEYGDERDLEDFSAMMERERKEDARFQTAREKERARDGARARDRVARGRARNIP